jgi:hypothetical protein
MADGRTALSQHRRRAHAKRRGRRRISFLLVTTITALVAIAAGVSVAISRAGGGTDPTAAALAAIPGSHSGALMEQQRQQMIRVDAAAKTLSLVGTPKLATRPSPSSGSSSSSSTGGGGGGGTPTVVNVPPPNPGTAQSIAFSMLPSYGFTPASTQFNCLDPLWNQESGWNYLAQNASGAYGIPQALPADKMASAGSDWQTNPRTQITWGLGYIKGTYGTPCNAWAHEQANGWY